LNGTVPISGTFFFLQAHTPVNEYITRILINITDINKISHKHKLLLSVKSEIFGRAFSNAVILQGLQLRLFVSLPQALNKSPKEEIKQESYYIANI